MSSSVLQGRSMSLGTRQSLHGTGCRCRSFATVPHRQARASRARVVATANGPKTNNGLQREVERFFQKYDIASASLGAMTVTTYCVWKGQDTWTALTITLAATVSALVINEFVFEDDRRQ